METSGGDQIKSQILFSKIGKGEANILPQENRYSELLENVNHFV